MITCQIDFTFLNIQFRVLRWVIPKCPALLLTFHTCKTLVRPEVSISGEARKSGGYHLHLLVSLALPTVHPCNDTGLGGLSQTAAKLFLVTAFSGLPPSRGSAHFQRLVVYLSDADQLHTRNKGSQSGLIVAFKIRSGSEGHPSLAGSCKSGARPVECRSRHRFRAHTPHLSSGCHPSILQCSTRQNPHLTIPFTW